MPSVALSEITPYKEWGLACTVLMHLFVKGLLFPHSKIIVEVLSWQAFRTSQQYLLPNVLVLVQGPGVHLK